MVLVINSDGEYTSFTVYEFPYFKGLEKTYTATENCQNDIVDGPLKLEVSSISSDGCVVFYTNSNCSESYFRRRLGSIVLVKGKCENLGLIEHPNYDDKVLSYKVCNNKYLQELESGTWIANDARTCFLM
uniref:Uncharacterized protein n=1 Tax=Acrobeloides nanus TaxID=290746 RepID=A0A914DZV2_9BILA